MTGSGESIVKEIAAFMKIYFNYSLPGSIILDTSQYINIWVFVACGANSQLAYLILGANLLEGFPVIFPLCGILGVVTHQGGENALSICLLKTQLSHTHLSSVLISYS